MSSRIKSISILAAMAGATLAVLASTGAANASATSQLSQCKSGSRGAAVACCQEVVRNHGVPAWLETRSNCNKSVECGKYSGKYKCYVTTQTWKLPKFENNNPGSGKKGGGSNNGNTKP